MRALSFLATAATFTTILAAQSGSFTCPPGYDTKAGDRYAYPYNTYVCTGLYTNLTFQTTDTGMPATAAVLQQLAYRTMTYQTYATYSGQGRTLSNVTLDIGYAKTSITSNFASNWSATPTRVYSANSVTLPTIASGKPTQAWGNPVKYPFGTVFVWLPNKGDLLQEWNVASGTLANGYTSISTYYLDSQYNAGAGASSYNYVYPSTVNTDPSRYLPRYYYNSAGGMCNDSAITYTIYDAYAYINLYVYGDTYSNSSYAGRAVVSSSYTYYTAPGKSVIGMLSLWGNDAGVNIGAACNKLHVNPQIPLAVLVNTASSNASATTGPWFPTTPFVKWNDNWAGAVVYWQAAWEDSSSKRFSLTNATRLVLPKKPGGGLPPEVCRYVYRYTYNTNTAASGPYGPYTSSYLNPIEGWNKK